MGLPELLKLLQDVGVAALFIAMYLTTVWYLYKELKAGKVEATAMVERMVTSLDKSSRATEDETKALDGVKASLDETRGQTREFLAFLRGRDAGGGKP